MPFFSELSKSKLATCDQRLQDLFNEVIQYVDCKIDCGHRNKEEQNAAYPKFSSVQWPNSRHNTYPSMAVDVIPVPVVWPSLDTMGPEEYARALGVWYMFVGFVRAIAAKQGIKIRCGADWNGNFQVKDQKFHDLPHFEIVE